MVACGSIETENYQVPMVAWYLNLESVDVSDQMPDSIAGQPSPPDPNVI